MAVLPFFELNVVAAHFSIINSADIPENVQKIMKNNICFSTCSLEDAMLIEIRNVGNGPAFSSEYNDNKEYVDINTNPPELILRISRVRYIQ